MAQTVKNVTAAKPPKKTGAIYFAPSGTTLPTDSTSTLSSAYVALGYLAEGGVTNSNGRSGTTVKAWGGDTVLTTVDEYTDTFKFTLIEALNPNVLKAVYGRDNVSGTRAAGVSVSVGNDGEAERNVWVIDMLMRDDTTKRIVIPEAELTNLDDIVYASNSAVGYGITLTAYPDDTNGKNHYEYIKNKS